MASRPRSTSPSAAPASGPVGHLGLPRPTDGRPGGTGSDAGHEAEQLDAALGGLLDVALAASEELEERVAPAHLRALQVLAALGPSQVSALADATTMLPSTASRLSDRLAAAGYITRTVSPANRRATLLELTRAGHEVLAELARVRTARLASVLAGMTPDDRHALVHGVGRFAEAAALTYRDDPSGSDGTEDPGGPADPDAS